MNIDVAKKVDYVRNLIIMIYNRILELMYGGARPAPPEEDNYARVKFDDDFMNKLP